MSRTVVRLDPKGCGCTDCILGDSVPVDLATDHQLDLMQAGYVVDATGIDWPPIFARMRQAARDALRQAITE